MPPLWKSTQIQGQTGARLAVAYRSLRPARRDDCGDADRPLPFAVGLELPLSCFHAGLGDFLPAPSMAMDGIGRPWWCSALPAHAVLYRRFAPTRWAAISWPEALLGLLATFGIRLGAGDGFRRGLDWRPADHRSRMVGVILVLASVGAAGLFWVSSAVPTAMFRRWKR